MKNLFFVNLIYFLSVKDLNHHNRFLTNWSVLLISRIIDDSTLIYIQVSLFEWSKLNKTFNLLIKQFYHSLMIFRDIEMIKYHTFITYYCYCYYDSLSEDIERTEIVQALRRQKMYESLTQNMLRHTLT